MKNPFIIFLQISFVGIFKQFNKYSELGNNTTVKESLNSDVLRGGWGYTSTMLASEIKKILSIVKTMQTEK